MSWDRRHATIGDTPRQMVVRCGAQPDRQRIRDRGNLNLAQGKSSEYRAKVADIVYQGIVGILNAPDRFIVVNEHKPENLIGDPDFLSMKRSPLSRRYSTAGRRPERGTDRVRRADADGSKVPRRRPSYAPTRPAPDRRAAAGFRGTS